MKKKRLIPILLLKNGWLVQSKEFSRFQNLGNPVTSVKRISEWAADELIYLDISRDHTYDLRREDLGHPNRHTIFEILDDVSIMANMPITVGGGIKTLGDIQKRLTRGADKVAINTAALENINFISSAAKEFGAQCIVISVDVKLFKKSYVVMSHCGQKQTQYDPVTWARLVEKAGAGEILLNSIDRDGTKMGYDIQLLNSVARSVSIPVIACGGVGQWSHFGDALEKTKVDAVAAANIFQYSDQSVYLARKYLFEQKFPVRPPDLLTV